MRTKPKSIIIAIGAIALMGLLGLAMLAPSNNAASQNQGSPQVTVAPRVDTLGWGYACRNYADALRRYSSGEWGIDRLAAAMQDIYALSYGHPVLRSASGDMLLAIRDLDSDKMTASGQEFQQTCQTLGYLP